MCGAVTLHGMLVSLRSLHVRVDVVDGAVEGVHLGRLAVRELDGVQVALGTRDVLRRGDHIVACLRSHGVAHLHVAR